MRLPPDVAEMVAALLAGVGDTLRVVTHNCRASADLAQRLGRRSKSRFGTVVIERMCCRNTHLDSRASL